MEKLVWISILLSIILIIGTIILNKSTIIDREKSSSYECGYGKFKEIEKKVYIKYFKIGLLYLIFDLESIVLYPIILGTERIWVLYIFIILIGIGLIYELRYLMKESL